MSCIVAAATEVISNTATATLLLPLMFDLVSTSNSATATLLLPLCLIW